MAQPNPESYTLSLHDALPIFDALAREAGNTFAFDASALDFTDRTSDEISDVIREQAKASYQEKEALDGREMTSLISSDVRSEEHTSELQSRRDLVCRLLLEKK